MSKINRSAGLGIFKLENEFERRPFAM